MDWEKLKACKTKQDYLQFISNSCTDSKYIVAYKKQIAAAATIADCQQIAWNCCLQDEGKYFLGKELVKKSWFKGSAIGGMECHSH